MKQFILICFLFVFLICPEIAFSQTKINKKNFVRRSFWTNFILATESDCKIEIAPDDLSPSEKFCSFSLHINANTEINLKKLSDEKDWAKLTFEVDNYEFDIFVKNNTKEIFRKSFDLAFSREKISKDKVFANCEVKTKLDIIRKVGFASRIQRDEIDEKWTYFSNFIQYSFCGYDETYIRIKNNKVTGISGII